MEDFDFNDTAPAPLMEQEFLMENLCVKKGRAPGGYEPPATRSAAKRWKHIHEQNMMTRLNEMHIIKKQNAQMSKEAAREIIRKIPVELLAKEWLSKEDATVDMRAYLVDHILPTLILGVERLLKEVDEKGLSESNRFEPEFNPINFLAQYLMRNNPRFSNFAEASPYVRGLREVSEEIKQELFTFEDNRLARIKAETRRKRTDRETHEQQIREIQEHRHNQMISQFHDWTLFTENKDVELAFLQNALRSFAEIVEQLPIEIQEVARFGRPLDPTDETGKTLNVNEFSEYINLFVNNLPYEVFQLFVDHMTKCAASQKASADKENRRIILTNLFLICDYGVLRFMIADRKLGLLDRARIMTLFEQYWDMLLVSKDALGTLRNPRKWPIIEVQEVDDILFDAWQDDPEGGIEAGELDKQKELLEAIKATLMKEVEVNAARDKIAKERWKKEQLEQKSEGYRAKLYKYNVTDFMNLVQYPLLDTMEAPIRYFDNTDGRLTKDHDLYASTITKTARERSKKVDYDFDFVKSTEEIKTSDGVKLSDENKSEPVKSSDETKSSSGKEKLSSGGKEESDSNKRADHKGGKTSTRKSKDKNTNARLQDFNYKDTKDKSTQFINRNNNTLGNERTSSEDNDDSSSSLYTPKVKKTVRYKRKTKRNVRFNCMSDESSEEIEFVPKLQLNFIKTESPFDSEDEFVRQMSDTHLFQEQSLLKYSSSLTSVGHVMHRMVSPTSLPPIRIRQKVELEQSNQDILKELLDSQNKLLGTKAAHAKFSGIDKNMDTDNASSMQEKDYFQELLDGNSNRKIEDSNINSCTRTREITAPTTSLELVSLSAFSETYVNQVQLIQLVETFIGSHPVEKVFATLVRFLTDGYQDNEPEKTEKLLEAREKSMVIRNKAMLNTLFEKWDNDASGFLELEDVATVMCRFKDGQEVDTIRFAQSELKKQSEYYDNILSKQEFRQFINMVIDELPGKETFDLFVEFLMNSVERSYADRIRGEARKKWIQQINIAAHTSGTSLEPIYKAVFQALYKDAETHGMEKRISASIAMLEVNKIEPKKGDLLLRYAACTPEDCQYMLGKPLFKNMKGVSFQAVETGKPVHVPRVAKHGNVYFWNYDRHPSERSGSFIVVPLKDRRKHVFGVLGVDTMIDSKRETIFITHEIQFFQGVAKAFSIAYHFVEKRRKFLRVLENAIGWFHRRSPHILQITVYIVEPSTRVLGDYVLRKMMIKDKTGVAVYVPELIRMERKDNLFCKYLFECMESSQTIVAEIRGAQHMACPIRDHKGVTVCILDLDTGDLRLLPQYESKEAQRILRLLQRAHVELSNVSQGNEPNCILEPESDPSIRTDLMFERIMLQELRDNFSRLDPQSYSEIKGYFEPPRAIADVLRATLAIFRVDQVGEGEYEDWEDLKNCINADLIQQIRTHDPIAAANLVNAEKLEKYLKATFSVSYAEVYDEGSIAAQQLYHWVFTCLALIEYILRMKEATADSVVAS